MKKLILTLAALLTVASSALAQIGSLSADLVFTPITPCRIVDTRGVGAGGVIPAASSRVFKGWAASFTNQGGSATNCGLPQTTDIAALAVNLLVIVPAAEGWIAAWPVGTAMPLVSNLNYKASDVLANSAILKINQTTADFNVYTVASTQLAVDVTGYYSKPVSAGSLDCTRVETTSAYVVGLQSLTATCAAGYIVTGGSCDTTNSAFKTITGSRFTDTVWSCEGNNFPGNTSAAGLISVARCCRISGR